MVYLSRSERRRAYEQWGGTGAADGGAMAQDLFRQSQSQWRNRHGPLTHGHPNLQAAAASRVGLPHGSGTLPSPPDCCTLSAPTADLTPELLQEIIEPGAPILEWHFSEDGQQVAFSYGQGNGQVTYALYDLATARIIEKLAEPSDESLLPQWAKSQAQIQDESVPMSAVLTDERTKWIAKVLRQIGKIRPGMRRRDLLTVFTTEGGISTRTQRT